MSIFLVVIHVIVTTALIGIILFQSGRGAGLASSFGGGGGGQSLFGVKSPALLLKITAILAAIYMLTSFALVIHPPWRGPALPLATPGVEEKAPPDKGETVPPSPQHEEKEPEEKPTP